MDGKTDLAEDEMLSLKTLVYVSRVSGEHWLAEV